MAKEKGITMQQKQYLSGRLIQLFNQAQQQLRDRSTAARAEAIQQVLAKAGLKKAEEEARKLQTQIDDLNIQYTNVTGHRLITYQISPLNPANGLGGVLGREVELQMGQTQSGTAVAQLQAYQQMLQDRINLSTAELDLMGILAEAETYIAGIMGQQKQLEAPKGKK